MTCLATVDSLTTDVSAANDARLSARLRPAASARQAANDNRFAIVSSYDADGNMLTGAGRTATYTSFNMAATIASGTTTNYLYYDSEHQRIRSGTLDVTALTFYLNDPISGAMSEQFYVSGTGNWRDYIRVDGRIVTQRLCTGVAPCSSGATMSYFVGDHLGSTIAATDASGNVSGRFASPASDWKPSPMATNRWAARCPAYRPRKEFPRANPAAPVRLLRRSQAVL